MPLLTLLALFALILSSHTADARRVTEHRGPVRGLDEADENAKKDLIMHDIGNVRMTLSNYGEVGNPDAAAGFKGFEFPINSGSDYLFSAGVWIGAEVDGEQRVSTATDGDNGTQEFYPVHIGTIPFARTVGAIVDNDWTITSKSFESFNGLPYHLGAKDIDDDGDWAIDIFNNDFDRDNKPSKNYDKGKGLINFDDDSDGLIDEDEVSQVGSTWTEVDTDNDSNFADTGISGDANRDGNCGYDPEPNIDEDPAGDMSNDYIDNDLDGLVDLADADLDGDLNEGSSDDDNDGLLDEDGIARGAQEYFTVFQDSISQEFVESPNGPHNPLQIQMLQRTYAFPEAYASGFILLDYRIRNLGARPIRNAFICMFADPDILAPGEGGDAGSLDDGNYYDPERTMMIQFDDQEDADGGGPGIFAIRVVKTPVPLDQLKVTFANFERNAGGDPEFDADKYALISSGDTSARVTQANLGDWRCLLSFGDVSTNGFTIPPGGELPITLAFIAGANIEEGNRNAEWALSMYLNDFQGPSAPDVPDFATEIFNTSVTLKWRANAEESIDAITSLRDFEGYIIERSTNQQDWQVIKAYDLIDTLEAPFEYQNFNLGMPEVCNEDGYTYCFTDNGLIPGQTYYYVIRAFDQGVQGAGVLVSGRTGNTKLAHLVLTDTTGAPQNLDGVFVYPNPYKGSHSVEEAGVSVGGITQYPRLLFFKGLPPNTASGGCIIRIFSLGGDHLTTIDHVNGTDGDQWDMNTASRQEIVSGLYYYTVEWKNPSGGTEQKVDKFVVLK